MALDPLTAGMDLASSIINKIWPDKTEAEKAQLQAAVVLIQSQLDVNKEEAKNPSTFVAGWRPFIGWICGLALFFQYIARPVVQWVSIYMGQQFPDLPGIDDNLWQLLLGMLGLGGLRTFEKVKGVA